MVLGWEKEVGWGVGVGMGGGETLKGRLNIRPETVRKSCQRTGKGRIDGDALRTSKEDHCWQLKPSRGDNSQRQNQITTCLAE